MKKVLMWVVLVVLVVTPIMAAPKALPSAATMAKQEARKYLAHFTHVFQLLPDEGFVLFSYGESPAPGNLKFSLNGAKIGSSGTENFKAARKSFRGMEIFPSSGNSWQPTGILINRIGTYSLSTLFCDEKSRCERFDTGPYEVKPLVWGVEPPCATEGGTVKIRFWSMYFDARPDLSSIQVYVDSEAAIGWERPIASVSFEGSHESIVTQIEVAEAVYKDEWSGGKTREVLLLSNAGHDIYVDVTLWNEVPSNCGEKG